MNTERGLPSTIAIDGPAASGKSTIAREVAARLNYLFFDTGVMYRAVTLAAIQRGVSPAQESAVTTLARGISIDVRPPSRDDGRHCDVILEGEDVTWAIRTAEVEANVSQVSAYAGVRTAMTQRQREIGLRGRVVMVGRDIGTVVLPEADMKIYLDASVEARAERRYQENTKRGDEISYQDVLDSMRERDRIDSTRKHAPLRPAADAVILDTTGLTVEQVLEKTLALLVE